PAVFYRGQVRGEPDSWARVTISDGGIDGIVYSGGETYTLTPLRALFGSPAGGGTPIFREADMAGANGACGLGGGGRAAGISSAAAVTGATTAGSGILRNTELTLVADYEWFQDHGATSATDMQTIINEADPIFRGDIGVRLTVLYTVVFDTVDDPFGGPP